MHTIKETRAAMAAAGQYADEVIGLAQRGAADGALDIEELHRKSANYLKFRLTHNLGVSVADAEDVYADALCIMLRVGMSEYDPQRGKPLTYALQKVWSASTAHHRKSNRRRETEVSFSDADRFLELADRHDPASRDEAIENLAPSGFDDSQLRLKRFTTHLYAKLSRREKGILDCVGLQDLDLDLSERQAASARLGLSTVTFTRALSEVRRKAASIWTEHFDSAVPDSIGLRARPVEAGA